MIFEKYEQIVILRKVNFDLIQITLFKTFKKHLRLET